MSGPSEALNPLGKTFYLFEAFPFYQWHRNPFVQMNRSALLLLYQTEARDIRFTLFGETHAATYLDLVWRTNFQS